MSKELSSLENQLALQDQIDLLHLVKLCERKSPEELFLACEKLLTGERTQLVVRVIINDARFRVQQHIEFYIRSEIPHEWHESEDLRDSIEALVREKTFFLFRKALCSLLSGALSSVVMEASRSLPSEMPLVTQEQMPYLEASE